VAEDGAVVTTISQRESFGLTLLEAFAADVRVVASDIPARRDTARYGPDGGACLVPVDAAPELVAARPSYRDASMPSWADVANGIAEAYRSLAKQLPRPRQRRR
jgi:glycosyltransferase involved in cell wall biosynthesis